MPNLHIIISINWLNFSLLNKPLIINLLDNINYLFSTTLVLVFLVLVAYSKIYLSGSYNYPYFEYVYNIFFVAMLLLLCSDNMTTALVAWEFLGLTSFLLITYYTLRIEANKSALKAMLLNKVGDFNFIFLIVYSHNIILSNHNIIINNIIYYYNYVSMLYILGVLLISSAITKSAQVLFSVWLPDAMEGPTPVSALLHSSTMVTAGYILISKYYSLSTLNNTLCDIILYIGTITYFSGTAKTTVCEDSKGSVAYSTVAQIGNLFISSILLPWSAAFSMFLSHALYKSGMFVSIGIDTSISKNNQDITTENSNEYLVDPFGELINIIGSCSAVGLPGFIAHKAKSSLVLNLDSFGNVLLIDVGTLLYIITLVGAITSIGLSIQTSQKTVYLYDVKKVTDYYNNKNSKLYQIAGFILTILSIITPLFLYNILNSQIIIQ